MRIGIVAPGGFDRSGVERTIPIFNWIVARLASRHDVRVFTLYQEDQPSVFPLLGATVQNIGRSPGRAPSLRTAIRCVGAIRRAHAAAPFDVLHGLWAGESGLAAVVAARWLRIPSVVSVLGAEIANLPEIGYGAQRTLVGRLRVRSVLRRATMLSTNSRYAATRMPIRACETQVIYQGADVDQFRPGPPPCAAGPWRLLHVGSLNRVKDQTTLLRAFRTILDEEPHAMLDIVGVDTLDGEMQRLAVLLGMASAVAFHGFQPPAVVADMMRRSHLLLHSSQHETGPVVFAEAAACGLPTVGTAVGILDDLRGSLCVTVPRRDHAALAQETLSLLQDAGRRSLLRDRLLEWSAEYDAGFTACEWERMYEESVRAFGRAASRAH